MTESKWTPEPWTSLPWNKIDSKMGVVMGRETGWISDHDRARAVACVNACAALDDPEADIRRLCENIAELRARDGIRMNTFAIVWRWLATHGGHK